MARRGIKDWREIVGARLDLIGLGGLGLLLLAHHLKDADGLYMVLVEIGIAGMVAWVIGRIIDTQLKKGLVEDAVEASMGYLLPDALKDELKWVYNLRFMVDQTFNVRLEHFPTENRVVFHASVVRRIKNVSGQVSEIKVCGGCDEWFRPDRSTILLNCGYRQGGKTIEFEPETTLTGLAYGDKDKDISVAPDETIEWFFSYAVPVYESGLEVLTHRYPILNPLVTLYVPETLVALVTYSHRLNFDHDDEPASGFISRAMEGVLLPHQDIRIHWYLAKSINQRRTTLKQ